MPSNKLYMPRPYAVFIDGSALFLAVRNIDDERKLNYYALIDVLCGSPSLQGLQKPGDDSESMWTMWTAADPRNAGQVKFLEFAEQKLRWQVRGTAPFQSYMIEPNALFGVGGPSEQAKASRLLRFDAAIAFAIGRLAETHRIVVVSDSYALREPMRRVSERCGEKCALAFFGHAVDTRWLAARRAVDEAATLEPDFIDLDAHALSLFGFQEQEVNRPAQEPDHYWY